MLQLITTTPYPIDSLFITSYFGGLVTKPLNDSKKMFILNTTYVIM